MLIVGHFYGIHFERRLCEEVELHLAHRWFCRLDLDDKLPKVISPTNPCSAWTEKANKRVQFGCGLNYMIDVGHARSMVERPKRRSV